ncbi:hypothetical protein TrispH2_008932, partial [Trichoplax sp. H2]
SIYLDDYVTTAYQHILALKMDQGPVKSGLNIFIIIISPPVTLTPFLNLNPIGKRHTLKKESNTLISRSNSLTTLIIW